MNFIDGIQQAMAASTSKAENDVRSALSADLTNDPTAMLAAQFALQRYTLAIGLQSAVSKDWKDMCQGIIAKI